MTGVVALPVSLPPQQQDGEPDQLDDQPVPFRALKALEGLFQEARRARTQAKNDGDVTAVEMLVQGLADVAGLHGQLQAEYQEQKKIWSSRSFKLTEALEKGRAFRDAEKILDAEDAEDAIAEQHKKLTQLVLHPDDIRAATDISWTVKKILLSDTTNVVAGARAALKSFWMQDIAFRIAAGAEMDFFGHPIVQGRWAVIVAAEGGSGYKQRMAAWEQLNNAKVERLLVYPRRLDMSLPGAGQMVADWLGEVLPAQAQVGLMVWDTLSKVRGAVNENSQDMGLVISELTTAREAFPGCCAVALHHLNTAGGMRGSTTIGDDADGLYLVKRPDKTYRTEITAEKVKDGPDGWELRLDLAEVPIGQDGDGEPITSLAVVFAEMAQAEQVQAEQASDKAAAEVTRTKATVALAVAALKAHPEKKCETTSVRELMTWMSELRTEQPAVAAWIHADKDRTWLTKRLDSVSEDEQIEGGLGVFLKVNGTKRTRRFYLRK